MSTKMTSTSSFLKIIEWGGCGTPSGQCVCKMNSDRRFAHSPLAAAHCYNIGHFTDARCGNAPFGINVLEDTVIHSGCHLDCVILPVPLVLAL